LPEEVQEDHEAAKLQQQQKKNSNKVHRMNFINDASQIDQESSGEEIINFIKKEAKEIHLNNQTASKNINHNKSSDETNNPEVYFYKPDSLNHDQSVIEVSAYPSYLANTINETNKSNWDGSSCFMDDAKPNKTADAFPDENSKWSANNSNNGHTTKIDDLDKTAVNQIDHNNSEWSTFEECTASFTSNKSINNKNKTTEVFPDQNSIWPVTSSDAKNKTAEKFYDESSNFTKKGSLELTTTDTVDYIANTIDQNLERSNWDRASCFMNHDSPNKNHNVVKNKTVNDSEREVSSLNHNKNMTVSRFHDESSNWTMNGGNSSVFQERTTLNGEKNQSVSRFYDESSNWTINRDNQSRLGNETLSNREKNRTASHFYDEDSNWTISKQYMNQTDLNNKNETVDRFPDEDSRWTVKSSASSSTDDAESDDDEKEKALESEKDSGQNDDEEVEIQYLNSMKGNVIHVNSLENFYFQAENSDVKLMEMKSILDQAQKQFDRVPSPGTFCICKYHVDKQFYRSQIIDCRDTTRIKVLYIDYGNEDYVNMNDIYKIVDSDLKNTEPLAKNCQLFITDRFKNVLTLLCNQNKNLNVMNLSQMNQTVINKYMACNNQNSNNVMNNFPTGLTLNLIKCFKNLTGNSNIVIKVRRHITNNKSATLLVDLFLKTTSSNGQSDERNILDFLLIEAINLIAVNSNSLFCKYYEEFNGFLINSGLNKQLELKVQNFSYIELVNNLIELFSVKNRQNKKNLLPKNEFNNSTFYLAELPEKIKQKFDRSSEEEDAEEEGINNVFGRVLLKNIYDDNNEKNPSFNAKFVDYDYETTLNAKSLIQINKHLDKLFKLIPNTIEKYTLHLDLNPALLSALKPDQFDYLEEIFKVLTNQELIGGSSSYSSRFKFVVSSRRFVRMLDSQRNDLDLNRILEMCLILMTNPFTGHVTHFENDYTQQFACLHEISKKLTVQNVMSKVLRAAGDYLFNLSALTEQEIKNDRLCLIDSSSSSKSVKKQKNVLPVSESILSLSEHAIQDNDEDEDQRNQSKICKDKDDKNIRDFFRGIIIDQSDDKCVVLNVDNGKQLTINNRRVRSIQSCLNNNSCLLLKLLPFKVIKFKLESSQVNNSIVQKILYDSR
jgi:hypothetical protein